jgi:hypothetical protein
MFELDVVSSVLDICSKPLLESVVPPVSHMSSSWTKAEKISHCLNTELGAYGFETYTSPDKTTVLINDESMCHVRDFLNDKAFQPAFTKKHLETIRTVVDFAEKDKVDIVWAQSGISKRYYYIKQFGFNGINLYNVLKINTVNSAAAALSPVGAAALTMGGVVALSFTGSLFFSTLENYIPNTMPRTKLVVSAAKFGTALPVRCVEWTSNTIFGFAENVLVGKSFPTNITDVYRLNVGPKLKNIGKFKKPALDWLVKQLDNLNK